MSWIDFIIRLSVAFILGAAIGVERQWFKTRSVLKTNVLVSLGAAMFVMMSAMVPGEASPTRVAAQVVSGVGFLGGGVILRDGTSVHGINTAATLWCAAAIGTLAGCGFFLPAYIGALAVVGANFVLRPIVPIFQRIEDSLTDDSQVNTSYRCRLVCEAEEETYVRNLLLQLLKERKIRLTAIHSRNLTNNATNDCVMIAAKLECSSGENTDLLEPIEQLINILKQQTKLRQIDWELIVNE